MNKRRGVQEASPQPQPDIDDMAFLFGAPTQPVKKNLNKRTATTSSIKKPKHTDNASINSDDEVSLGPITTSIPALPNTSLQSAQSSILGHEDVDQFAVSIAKDAEKIQKDKQNSPIQKGFSQLGISPWLVSQLTKLRIVIPTDIQTKCLPTILQGNNVIARAKTGSGKTAAFALPILEHLSHDPYGIYALVLTPTRELALQIQDQFNILGAPIGIQTCCVIGGIDMIKQSQEIENRPHVLISTPGRLSDLLVRGSIPNFGTKHLKYLVLDEADRLFEDCFKPFLHTILDSIPDIDDRYTLLFSATITQEMLQTQLENDLYHRLIKNPIYHSTTTTDEDNIVDTLTQKFCFFPQQIKEAYIFYLLQFGCSAILKKENEKRQQLLGEDPAKLKKPKPKSKNSNDDETQLKYLPHEDPNHPTRLHQSCIVFTRTVKTAHFLHLFLNNLKIPNVALHSGIRQQARTENLTRFRQGGVRILVATDIAARGLDIPSVSLVLNYDLPFTPQDYIHRVGRTARANRNGLALTFVTQHDIQKLHEIEQEVGVKLSKFDINESNVIANLKLINERKKWCQLQLEVQDEKKAQQ